MIKPAVLFLVLTCSLAAQAQSAAAPKASQSETPADGHAAPAKVQGNLEVLSDTQGVDFGPYLSQLLKNVRTHWYELIPEEARKPQLRSGEVTIQFVILPTGKVAGMQLKEPSGIVSFDRAAWGGITASDPFAPLPKEFKGPYLALRMHFSYNPKQAPTEPKPSDPK